MEFRAPNAIQEEFQTAKRYLTNDLEDPAEGVATLEWLVNELGNCVYMLPHWHPILRRAGGDKHTASIQNLDAYSGADHTVYFVRGFVTCPYSEEDADRLVNSAKQLDGIHAYRLNQSLYMDSVFPVVVESYEVSLEADGTISTRDAMVWFVEWLLEGARDAKVAETWWNIRSYILGQPHGSRSSIAVNQYAGRQMRRVLETLNDTGIFGPVLESSLDMLSAAKRKRIAETLMNAAFDAHDGEKDSFDFDLRGETCRANVRDTFDDESEFNIDVIVGDRDLVVQGFYYPRVGRWDFLDPVGKRRVAEKFA